MSGTRSPSGLAGGERWSRRPRQVLSRADMPNVGPLEIVIVLVLVLVIFGPKRLPELGRSLGRGMREFKQSITGEGGSEETPRKEIDGGGNAPSGSDSTASKHETPSGG